MAKEIGKQGVSGRDGGGAGAGRGRRDPVVGVTPEQQRWLEAVVRPVVEEAAARLVGVDADVDANVAADVDVGEVAHRRRQRRTRWILLGLLVLVGLLGLGVLVGAWFAHGLAAGAAIVP